MQFADRDSPLLIRFPSQLAFILQSRLFGLALSDDCCGSNWQNGLWLSSPHMRFSVFDSRNSFRQGGLLRHCSAWLPEALIPGEDNGQRLMQLVWIVRSLAKGVALAVTHSPNPRTALEAAEKLSTKGAASVVPQFPYAKDGFSR